MKLARSFVDDCPDSTPFANKNGLISVPSPTITGMALYLGFASRRDMDGMANDPLYSDAIKYAKSLIERTYEKKLHTTAAVGAIFALKQLGWRDEQHLTVTRYEDLLDNLIDVTPQPEALPPARQRKLPPQSRPRPTLQVVDAPVSCQSNTPWIVNNPHGYAKIFSSHKIDYATQL